MINAIWEYSYSLWTFRNGEVHGHTLAEAAARELEETKRGITAAFLEYEKDQFIVPSHIRSLFISKSLQQRLTLDIDSMHCWLRSFHEAKATQQESLRKYSEAAKSFFQPQRKREQQQHTTSVEHRSLKTLHSPVSDSLSDNATSTVTSSGYASSVTSRETSTPSIPSRVYMGSRRS